ncbi:MAG: hypothetical protein AAGF35_03915 [Pseudomonadota bacterium]
MPRIAHWLILSFLLFSYAANADSDETYSCLEAAAHREFDFWVGRWQVTDQSGDKVFGHNTITIEEAGCLLREQWQSISGGSGSSINYFHPADGKWHQLWIDAGSSIIDIQGEMDDGSMVLSGSIFYLKDQRRADFRGTWTPLADGTVRQFFEERDSEGNWQTWFDGYYRPLPEADTETDSP